MEGRADGKPSVGGRAPSTSSLQPFSLFPFLSSLFISASVLGPLVPSRTTDSVEEIGRGVRDFLERDLSLDFSGAESHGSAEKNGTMVVSLGAAFRKSR